MTKAHDPTPEERDESCSLYGLDPEKVIEVMLRTKPEDAPASQVSRLLRRSAKRPVRLNYEL